MIFEVVHWNTDKAYGFLRCIEPGQPRTDCFAYIRHVKDHINLQIRDIVTADIRPSDEKPGRQDAINIVLKKRDEVAKDAQ
jgi:hypothetical protein